MARGDNSGLFTLLDAMARRDQLSESRMDRELRRDQLMLALEQVRGDVSLNREKMDLERARTAMSFELERAKMGMEQKRFDLDVRSRELEFKVQLGQLKIAEQQAYDAHRRNDIDISMMEDQQARTQVEDLRTKRDDLKMTLSELDASIVTEQEKNAKSYTAILATFGSVVDGKFQFNELYKEIYKKYVRGRRMPKGTSQEMVATIWAEELGRQYRGALNTVLEKTNAARRASGLPEYTSTSQLSNLERQSASESAYRDWMGGSSGPLVMAAVGDMTQAQYESLIAKHDGNEEMVLNELKSKVRFGGKSIKIGAADLEGYLSTDPNKRGNRDIADGMNMALRSFGPTVLQSMADLASSADNVSNYTVRRAAIANEMSLYSLLHSQANLNAAVGRGAMTPEQIQFIKDGHRIESESIGVSPVVRTTVDGKPVDPAAVVVPSAATGGGLFSRVWLEQYKRKLAADAADAHAAADTLQKGTSDPNGAASVLQNVTGVKMNPFTPLTPQGFAPLGATPADSTISKPQASALRDAVNGSSIVNLSNKSASEMTGPEFFRVANSMNGETFMDWATRGWRERAKAEDDAQKAWIASRREQRQASSSAATFGRAGM